MTWRGWLLVAAAAAVLGYGGYRMSWPRGLRNNNPGNIRRTYIEWQGEVPNSESRDDAFEVFEHPGYGLRAMAMTLVNYQQRHGRDTVREVITRWAPPSENNTGAYVQAVADAVGVDPDDEIDVRAQLLPMMRAITRHENGIDPYGEDLYRAAIEAAYPGGDWA